MRVHPTLAIHKPRRRKANGETQHNTADVTDTQGARLDFHRRWSERWLAASWLRGRQKTSTQLQPLLPADGRRRRRWRLQPSRARERKRMLRICGTTLTHTLTLEKKTLAGQLPAANSTGRRLVVSDLVAAGRAATGRGRRLARQLDELEAGAADNVECFDGCYENICAAKSAVCSYKASQSEVRDSTAAATAAALATADATGAGRCATKLWHQRQQKQTTTTRCNRQMYTLTSEWSCPDD